MDPPVLLVFPLLLALPTPCNACDCKIQHPQAHYCTSDIVILADIQGPGNKTVTKQGFRVNVIKVLKAPRGNPRIQEIYSPIPSKECAYKLRTAQQSQLLIAGYMRGGTLRFTRCHLVYFWYRLSREQRLGFEGAYRTGCKCRVQPCVFCWRPCPEPDVGECVWKQRGCRYKIWEGNHSLHSMCAPSASGRCEWTPIPRSHQYQTSPPALSLR
ncbi:metalloproteinase inhibitor 1-like [Suricata suricatta]|uniref:NTR domain-containing protein n=1 Tax=Suricata suricatta TaxID=37032 RepID=A0A673UMA5_SURSU|nr:metalloproteinase inhibitor 1-like [Suricata suricatta]